MQEKFELGRENLEKLITWYADRKGDRNEATTRLHLIDTIIFDVLGWEKDNVSAEDSHEGEYTDYTLRNTRVLAILEAKKEA